MHIFKHFCTVIKHKHYVFINCVRAGIPLQGLVHDLSKFTPCEFFTSAKYFIGTGSPIPNERKDKGYSTIWMHHTKHNKHHIEYWMDNDRGHSTPIKMPLRYVKEMFCDMVSASMVYKKAAKQEYSDKEPLQYFLSKGIPEMMHKDSALMIEKMLTVLAQKGSKEAFRYIRRLKKNDY